MKPSPRNGQRGAVALEAMGLSIVLLAMLVLIFFVGSAYWNVTVLNTAANSAALASQTLVSSYCSGTAASGATSAPSCLQGTGRAYNVVDKIIYGDPSAPNNSQPSLQSQLIGTTGPVLLSNNTKAPNCSAQQPYPAEIGGSAPKGWGYSFIALRTSFHAIGTPGSLPIRATAMAGSYQPVCSITP